MTIFVISLIISGCSLKQPKFSNNLSESLNSLGIDKDRSQILSQDIQSYFEYLQKEYEAASPALFHNFLVNTGIKDKGLCYEYAFAMYAYLKKLPLEDLDIVLIQADKGEYFEHNAVALCAEDKSFQECLVIDAWRDKKNLFFGKVKEDKYAWMRR